MDHCKVGRWMGVSWNYMPSFIDVFEFHHAPEKAQHDPYLVGIVAAADQFLVGQATPPEAPSSDAHPAASASEAPNHAPTHAPHAPTAASPAAAPPSTPGSSETSAVLRAVQPATPSFLEKCLPELVESERQAVMDMLHTEYLHLLPLVQLGMTVAAADGA
jgi:hypothetical protein